MPDRRPGCPPLQQAHQDPHSIPQQAAVARFMDRYCGDGVSKRTTLPSSGLASRTLRSSARLISSQVSGRIALIVFCSTVFCGDHGSRAKERKRRSPPEGRPAPDSSVAGLASDSPQRKTASASRLWRPVALTLCRHRSRATKPTRSRCSSSRCDVAFSSQPISREAKRSNMSLGRCVPGALSAPAVAGLGISDMIQGT
jgi:hypothetical protein